jgi:hypothetical protein
MNDRIILPISVVIPTLGDECLLKTLTILNSKIYIPFEILVCIPSDLKNNVANIEFTNVKKIFTNHFGQVLQRAEGFKSVSQDFVLQLDDDLEFDGDSLLNLYKELTKLDIYSAIGPQYYNINRNKFCYENIKGINKIESYIVEFFIGGSKFGKNRMGTISKSGNNFGYDINYMRKETIKVDWLAGGCVLHHKKNLITINYYPFSGKAYCEDLMHSFLLKNNNINLYLTKNAICSLEDTFEPTTPLEVLREKTARCYLLILNNGSITRFRFRRLVWAFLFKLKNIV